MPSIEYLSGARRDFDESFDWYAERTVEAALRFAAAVDRESHSAMWNYRAIPGGSGVLSVMIFQLSPFSRMARKSRGV